MNIGAYTGQIFIEEKKTKSLPAILRASKHLNGMQNGAAYERHESNAKEHKEFE